MEPAQRQAIRSHLGPHVENIRKVFNTIEQENRVSEHKISVVPSFAFPISKERKEALRLLKSGKETPESTFLAMLKNGDEQVVEAGMRLRNIENNYKGQEREKLRAAAGRLEETHPLLYNRNQWLASKNPSAAAERIGKVAAIIRRLRREHPDEVVGVNLFGGTVRGYMNGESDLDYTFIGSEHAAEKFRKRLQEENITPCEKRSATMVPGKDQQRLFGGLFVGDKDGLRKLQVNALEEMGPETWKMVAYKIKENEGSLDKHRERHGIDVREDIEPSYDYVNAGLQRFPQSSKDALLKTLGESRQYKKHFKDREK